jgi:hypothetical protein
MKVAARRPALIAGRVYAERAVQDSTVPRSLLNSVRGVVMAIRSEDKSPQHLQPIEGGSLGLDTYGIDPSTAAPKTGNGGSLSLPEMISPASIVGSAAGDSKQTTSRLSAPILNCGSHSTMGGLSASPATSRRQLMDGAATGSRSEGRLEPEARKPEQIGLLTESNELGVK